MEREQNEQTKKLKDEIRAQARKKREEEWVFKEQEKARIEEEKKKEKVELDERKDSKRKEEMERESQRPSSKFLEYIKSRKVTSLTDLGTKFQLKTERVIAWIKILEDEGALCGIIDDNGKYIYITQMELDAIAGFIKQRGRFSVEDFAGMSSTLIDLSPTVQT